LASNFAALQKEAVMIEEQWRKLRQPPVAAAAEGGTDFDLSAESSDQMRQTIALELLDELKTLWQQQELTIRQRFRLPVSRDLYAASVGAMLGSNLLLEQSLEEK
jgi:hypothetical protein